MKLILARDRVLQGVAPGEDFAITFAEAKFNSIVQRGGTFSNVIKFALTPSNLAAIGYANEPNEQSLRPYELVEAVVIIDGVQVFVGEAILEDVQDFIGVRVFGALSGLFSRMGDLMLQDLDLAGLLNVAYTAANVYAYRNEAPNLGSVVFPAINYGTWTGSAAAQLYTTFKPAYYLANILSAAATRYGYALQSYFETTALPFSKKEMISEIGARYAVEIGTDWTVPNSATNFAQVSVGELDTITSNLTLHNYSYTYAFTPPSPYDPITGYGYLPRVGGVYEFKGTIVYDISGLPSGTEVRFSIAKFSTATDEVITELGPEAIITADGTGTVQVSANYTYGANEYITIMVRRTGSSVNSGTYILKAGTKFECTSAREPIAPGEIIPAVDMLPKMKQKDLFLFEAVRLNALIIVNETNKTVRFVKFNSIVAKAPAAKDWSGRVDLTRKPKHEYHLQDFAQRNIFEFSEGSEQDPAFLSNPQLGRGVLEINDTTLEAEKVLYKAPFAASALQPSFDDQVHMLIPVDVAGGPFDPKQRVCFLEQTTDFAVDISGESASGTMRYGVPFTWQEMIDENYSALIDAVQRCRLIEVDVNLNTEDVQGLDITTPVYLLGAHWFIREVKEYVLNRKEVTQLKLMRI